MKVSRLTVAALAAVMILSVLSPLGAVAADEGDPSIDVEENGDVLVTVTDGENNALENATVNVSVEDGVDYEGAGEDTTDENGTVALPEPEETVDVTIKATYDDVSTETDETLKTPEDEDLELAIDVEQDDRPLVTVTDNATESATENASLNVTTLEENATYDGVGNYTTDENGTVALSVPNESVDVALTASYENESVTEEVTLKSTEDQIVEENDIFGNMVSAFVASLEPSESEGGIGSQVASFVLEHNPGNAPDHAGPPEHAGPDGDGEQGPPEHAGPGGDGEQGPPADDDRHQGPPADEDSTDEETEEDSTDEETEEDSTDEETEEDSTDEETTGDE